MLARMFSNANTQRRYAQDGRANARTEPMKFEYAASSRCQT